MPRLLSYPLGPSTPTFDGEAAPAFEPVVLTARGEPGNVHRFSTVNHMSTHLDAPWHFNHEGLRLTDLGPEWFVYSRPVLIDLPAADATLITPDDLAPFTEAAAGADLLLIRTGFGRCRATDPQRWGSRNPAFRPDAAEWFMALHDLRAVGMDVPSALCPLHLEDGIEFHRNMLGRRREDRFVLIVEDVRIDDDLTTGDLTNGVVVAPLLLEDLDGAPATVIAL